MLLEARFRGLPCTPRSHARPTVQSGPIACGRKSADCMRCRCSHRRSRPGGKCDGDEGRLQLEVVCQRLNGQGAFSALGRCLLRQFCPHPLCVMYPLRSCENRMPLQLGLYLFDVLGVVYFDFKPVVVQSPKALKTYSATRHA